MSSISLGITDENFHECIELCKQIFWMYHDISFYGCIVHDVDYENIDYERYIMCEVNEERLKSINTKVIIDVVNKGCFIALCCHVVDILEEGLEDDGVISLIESLLLDERINEMIFEKDLLIAMKDALSKNVTYPNDKYNHWTKFPEGKIFEEKISQVYKKYIIGYYEAMIAGNIDAY